MAVKICSTMGYLSLDIWVLSNIIQLGTQDFCEQFRPMGQFAWCNML
ncbi:MAG: hypothetical protein M0P12_07760 [Paludibacteraceae bacterium]|nr:hypothetical protein [Paludibacteraceae bacterium]